MLLSIGMIVKNEEKYLEECLTALKPILEQVDSELIIADTGSTDRTVEIAEKFTDNVFHFEWINDFAAARNSTIDRAKGEWYMYLDADEIIKDCSDIIRFFNSGEYKKFGSAMITIRNYSDLAFLDSYQDFNSPRLTLLRKEVRFVQPVHEHLSVAIRPRKELNIIADHYGYLYFDNNVLTELAIKKSERNLKILLDELAEQEAAGGKPRDAIYLEIATSYHIIGDYEKTLEYLKKGLEILDPRAIYVIAYYNDMLGVLWNLNRFVEITECFEWYFSKENLARTKPLATDCFVYFSAARAYFELHNYERAVPCFVSGFDAYEKYVNRKQAYDDQTVAEFRVTIPILKTCLDVFFNTCRKVEQDETTAAALKKFHYPPEILADKEYMRGHLMLWLTMMENTGFSPLENLYSKLDDYNKEKLISMMRWYVFRLPDPTSAGENLKKILKGNKQLEDTAKLYYSFFAEKALTPEAVRGYISEHGTDGNENILCIMLLAGIDITPFITAGGFDVKQSVLKIYNNSPVTSKLFEDYDIDVISPEGLAAAADVYILAMIVTEKKQKDIVPLFEKFAMIGAKLLETESNRDASPRHVRAAITADRAVRAQKSGNYTLCRIELDSLVNIISAFDPLVTAYSSAVLPDISEEQPASEPAKDNEFKELAEQVKKNINLLIGMGKTDEAQALLAEYEKLCPDDSEAVILKRLIEAEM